MGLTFRKSLIRLLFWSIVVTVVVILINVWSGTAKLVEDQLDNRLAVAENVFKRFQQERQQDLLYAVRGLVSDESFVKAINEQQLQVVQGLLKGYHKNAEADFMALLDDKGNFQISEPNIFIAGIPFEYPRLMDVASLNRYGQGIGIIDGQPYQMIVVPTDSQKVNGFVLIGSMIDIDLLLELKSIIHVDLITHNLDKEGIVGLFSSTLDSNTSIDILKRNKHVLSWANITLGKNTPYVSKTLTLTENNNETIGVTLAANVQSQYRRFNSLQLSITSISILAILLSIGVSFILARRITQPLSVLVEGAKRIAAGDYAQSLDVSGKLQEIKHFANAFSTMQNNIATREKRISYQAQHDNLTTLYNRSYIKRLIDHKISIGAHIQVIGINVMGFRQINDLYGYENGDSCLKQIAERLTRWPGDAARLSGSDMYWIPESPLDEVKLETLKFILEQPIDANELTIPIRISIGIMDLPQDSKDAEHLFRRMNIVKDEAQLTKQWLVRYSEHLETRYLRRLDIITELKRTLLKNSFELSLVYQPKVCFKTNQVVGLEALLRWNNSLLGVVNPDEFIPIAEQAGLIETVTEWVMERVIEDKTNLNAAGYEINIALNLSSHDIENSGLLGRFLKRLESANLSPNDIELEITESGLVINQALALANLSSLRKTGFNIAIDDFGTGYSSLTYLKNLPIDTLKIDKSFVLNLATNKQDQKIVNIVLKLASDFDLMTVAEGVEDEMAFTLLKEWGCTLAQGYFVSKPIPYNDLLVFLEKSSYTAIKSYNEKKQQ